MPGVRLYGRENAMRAIEVALARARAGNGNVLCLLGDEGLGKTTLLDFARERSRGLLVGQGRGELTGQAVPFGLLRQIGADFGVAIDNRAARVDAMAAFHRSLRWLEQHTDDPVLLLADDLHWSDADSLNVLAFLARRVGRLPVAIIVAMRDSPSPIDGWTDLVTDGSVRVERLAPLDRACTDRLLDDYVGHLVPNAIADPAWELCRGNPLLATELGRALAAGRSPGELDPRREILSAVLQLSRFAGLSESTMAFARAAGVLGTTFRPSVVGEVANLLDSEIHLALEELFGTGLIIVDLDRVVRFAHPVFGRALAADVLPAIRRRLHARAFTALARRGLEREAAAQARLGDAVGDREAVTLLWRTGDLANSAGALASALVDYDAAIRFSGDRPAAGLLLARAGALVSMGRLHEAEQAAAQVLAEPDAAHPDRMTALRITGRVRYLSGAPKRGDRAFEQAAAIAVAGRDVRRAAEALLDQSSSAWWAGGVARALPVADRARSLTAARAPASVWAVVAEQVWSCHALEAGVPEGIAAAQRTVDTQTDAAGSATGAALTVGWPPSYHVGINASHLERYEEAEAIFTRARAVAERAGSVSALGTLAVHLTNLFIRRGRLGDALTEAAHAEDFAELIPDVIGCARMARAEALAWSGRDEESAALCAQVADDAGEQWLVQLWAAHVRGMLLHWRADPRASDELLRAEQITRAAGIGEPCHLQWGARAVDAHLRVGRVGEARRLVDWLESCAAPLPCRWPRIAAAVGRAHLAAHDGRTDLADREFQKALVLHDETDLPLHRVETLISYGTVLRRSARTAEARPLIAAAGRMADELGAGALGRLAQDELRLVDAAHGPGRHRADDGLAATA